MVANSLFLTIAILLALGFWLLGELKFFIPYKTVLFHEYGTAILAYLATLFLNLFAAAFVLNRKFFLKDTGRKLSHLDKQFARGADRSARPISRRGAGLTCPAASVPTNSSIHVITLAKLFETLGQVTVPSLLGNRAKGANRKRMVG